MPFRSKNLTARIIPTFVNTETRTHVGKIRGQIHGRTLDKVLDGPKHGGEIRGRIHGRTLDKVLGLDGQMTEENNAMLQGKIPESAANAVLEKRSAGLPWFVVLLIFDFITRSLWTKFSHFQGFYIVRHFCVDWPKRDGPTSTAECSTNASLPGKIPCTGSIFCIKLSRNKAIINH